MRIAQFISGWLIFVAILISWCMAFPLSNRVRICFNRAEYRPAVFEVVGADYETGDHSGGAAVYWLTGRVEGRAERLTLRLPSNSEPSSAEDLLARYPRQSKIDVLYNPNETETIVQNESLRVLQWTPDFWQRQERDRNLLLAFVAIPVPLTVGIYLTVRRRYNRRQQTDTGDSPA